MDPEGVAWSVQRRWYPWRRALSLREIFHSTPDGDAESDKTEPEASEASDTKESQNPVAQALFLTLGFVVWAVIGLGKALFIVLAVLLVFVLSALDLLLQGLVLPFALLARMSGWARWPVQINRERGFYRTEHAGGFSAAASLRDDLAAQIQRGQLAPNPEQAEKVPAQPT